MLPALDTPQKILVALSGGVDSSVCAALLVEQGHEVIGVTCVFCRDEAAGIASPDASSIERARGVATQLGIAHHVVDVQECFERNVLVPFARGYAAGQTPNPCVVCNPGAKFAALVEAMDAYGCSALATGHYAFVDTEGNLLRAADGTKDQSYFLYRVPGDVLARVVFPLAGITKEQVRHIARDKGLSVAETPESQDVCFAGVNGSGYKAIIRRYAPGAFAPGDIVDEKGCVLGVHTGIANYTIGQRKGLGIAAPEPLYVTSINAARNQVVVGGVAALARNRIAAGDIIIRSPLVGPVEQLTIKIRHGMEPVGARVRIDPAASGDPSQARIICDLDTPVSGVAPGQSLVCYRGDVTVCGGIIT